MLPMLLPLPTCLADPQELDVLPGKSKEKKKRSTARPGSSSQPRGLPPASADPDRIPAAWRSDFCRVSHGGWEKNRSRLGQKWPRSVHVCLRHMHCVMCVTPCARVHAHCYAFHTTLCARPTMSSCTRAHPPTVPACAHPFLVEMRVMANVVGSSKEKRTTARPGSRSRPRGLPPASADPDRTHFTTLTIRDGESPSADDLPGHPQTTSPAIRRRPLRPSADDLRPSADDLRPSADDLGHPADDLGVVRKQTTTGRPHADDHGAVRKQTTSGHPETTSGHPQTTSGHPQTTSGHPQTTSGHPQTTRLDPSALDGNHQKDGSLWAMKHTSITTTESKEQTLAHIPSCLSQTRR